MSKTLDQSTDHRDYTLKEFCEHAHKTALEHGWWEKPRTLAEQIVLMHSELSEAIEAIRNGEEGFWIDPKSGKPEGIATELADCIIRIMDTCKNYGWDLEEVMLVKMAYNDRRPYRHGGKAL